MLVKAVFDSVQDIRPASDKVSFLKDGIDGHADSIRLLLNSRNYVNHNSEEHFMVRLLTTAL